MEIENFAEVIQKKQNEEDYEEDYEEDDEEEYEEDDMDNVVSSNGELLDPLKKKRGRKPKPKEEDEEKTQKKRGRKPKPKEDMDDEDEKAPKKRGRKPKEKTYSVKEGVTTDSTTVVEKTETVILHLPLKKEQEETVEPSPYLKRNINYSMISSTYSVLENVDMTNVKMVPKKDEFEEEEEKNELKNDYDAHYSFLDQDGGEEEVIKEEEKVEETPKVVESVSLGGVCGSGISFMEDEKSNKVVKKNLKNIMYEFVNSNSANTWPESTNTCCWWCCNTFEGMPCALPELYRKDKFYVSGVFCSFNCAASYNFSKNDGEDMWMRYSLLNLMYRKMFHGKFVKIGLAPPREVLKMFGGYMCIDEFRETSLRMDRTFNVIKPPMVAIIPKIEENVIHRGIRTGNTNEHILNKTQNNLKLKRTKPLMNPNSTLQSFMNIKIV